MCKVFISAISPPIGLWFTILVTNILENHWLFLISIFSSLPNIRCLYLPIHLSVVLHRLKHVTNLRLICWIGYEMEISISYYIECNIELYFELCFFAPHIINRK